MILKHLLEAETIKNFRDPDHDPEVMKSLGNAMDKHAKAAMIATPKWEALAKKLKSKRTVIQERPSHSTIPLLSISVGNTYYIRTMRDALEIACNDTKAKFDQADKDFVKTELEKAGRKLYPHDLGSTAITIGSYTSMSLPKWERAIKAITAYFMKKQEPK